MSHLSVSDFEEFVKQNMDILYSYISRRVNDGDAVGDLLQITLEKLFRSISSDKKISKQSALFFAFRIAHNVIIDEWRKNNKVDILDEDADIEVAVQDNDDSKIIWNVFYETVAQMKDETMSRAIYLRYAHTYKIKEISKELGIPHGKVKRLIDAGKHSLRLKFRNMGYDPAQAMLVIGPGLFF